MWGAQRHLLILATWVENCKQPRNFVCSHGVGRGRLSRPGGESKRGCILTVGVHASTSLLEDSHPLPANLA